MLIAQLQKVLLAMRLEADAMSSQLPSSSSNPEAYERVVWLLQMRGGGMLLSNPHCLFQSGPRLGESHVQVQGRAAF